MPIRHCVLFIFLSLPLLTTAQAIDNTLSFKNISTDNYVRISYENDFFSGTDVYYTQGLHLETVAPFVKKLPVNKLLLHPHFSYIRYGMGAEHDGYTPRSYSNPHLLIGDRPYAACLFVKSFLIAIDSERMQRFSSSLSAGVIGQAAGGMEMQTGIHRWLHDAIPRGWPNQVHNDLILNYQANYEKQIFHAGHFLSIDAGGMARAGTLSDKAGLGLTVMIGYFESPFETGTTGKNNFRVYAYEHPEVSVIGYDATLQGGMFNHSSPYVVPAADINLATFQNRFGVVVVYKRMFLEYFQSLISSEFKGEDFHVWGGIQIAFGI